MFAAAVAADPEKLLWTPGAKSISIPRIVSPARWRVLGYHFIASPGHTLDQQSALAQRLLEDDVARLCALTMLAPQFRESFDVHDDLGLAILKDGPVPMRLLSYYDRTRGELVGRVDTFVRF